MVPAQTTMRGFGGEGPRRRTATLRSYRPFDDRSRQAALPALYRELLESVYANVGLSHSRLAPSRLRWRARRWRPTSTSHAPSASCGSERWDEEAGTALKRAVRHLLSQHVDVVYADVDLVAVADVNEATAELNELGFFAAGLVLHGPDGHDHFRLQLLDSEEIELEDDRLRLVVRRGAEAASAGGQGPRRWMRWRSTNRPQSPPGIAMGGRPVTERLKCTFLTLIGGTGEDSVCGYGFLPAS